MSNLVHLQPGISFCSNQAVKIQIKDKCLLHLISIHMWEAGTPELKSFKWVWLVADILAYLFISLSFFPFMHHGSAMCRYYLLWKCWPRFCLLSASFLSDFLTLFPDQCAAYVVSTGATALVNASFPISFDNILDVRVTSCAFNQSNIHICRLE